MEQERLRPQLRVPGLWVRAHARLLREGARFLFKRPLTISADVPIISFTFDDFPRSAFLKGAPILNRYGISGTFYVSLGLMGKQGPPGAMFWAEDLKALARQGHEFGCHTFGHYHSLNTRPATFEKSIVENRQALSEIVPGATFRTFAYPISAPRPDTKRRASRHFLCCRGGGGDLAFNAGTTDLNYLSAFFLEKRRNNPAVVKDLIDRNARERGWLILVTHDVCVAPSPYGCTPDFFEQVVRWAVESGARILPVVQAVEVLSQDVN